MKLKEIAKYMQTKLLEQGFIIHRYDAYSTNSIYLKLDYGACHSIRISDHGGKKHLSYKYNVERGICRPGWHKDSKGFWKYYCSTSENDVNNLINIIMADKLKLKTYYNYNLLIDKHKSDINNSIGFWKDAREVKLDVLE